MKIVNFEEENLHIFWRLEEFQWNSQERCGLYEILELNINLTEKLSKIQKLFVEFIMYNGKLTENCLLTTVRLYDDLKTKSWIVILLGLYWLLEKLKHVYL